MGALAQWARRILLIFLTLKSCGGQILVIVWEDVAQIGVLDAPWCHS